MTKADITLSHSVYTMILDGHADDARVCAAVSQTVTMLANALRNFDEHVYKMELIELAPGDVEIRAEGDEVCAGWFRMAGVGLLGLQKAHPEHIETRMIDII